MARFSLLRNRTHLGRQTECGIRSKVLTACLIEVTMEPAKKFRTFQLCSELHFARQTQPEPRVLQVSRLHGPDSDEKINKKSGSGLRSPNVNSLHHRRSIQDLLSDRRSTPAAVSLEPYLVS